jgi:NAD(P)H-nitrite reductase large subunit
MLPKGANLQKIRDGKKTYAITPHLPGGFMKPEVMESFARVARKYHGTLKLTSAQRVMITGLEAEDVDNIWNELGMEPAMGFANCVRSVKICPGTAFCKRGKQDSIKLGLELDRRYIKKEMPSRMKLGVSGCLNSCSEAVIKDIGVIGTDDGWDVYAGGSAGSHPRLADQLITGLNYDDTLKIIDIVVRYYQKNADIERVGQFIDRIGFEKFKTDILAEFNNHPVAEAAAKPFSAGEKIIPKPGGLTEGNLVFGDKITAESVIADIIRV